MSSRKEFIGIFKIELSNGEKRRIYIYKHGSSIYLDDFLKNTSLNNILVHPSNQDSQNGWIREYELCRKVQIKNWNFLPPHLLKFEKDIEKNK